MASSRGDAGFSVRPIRDEADAQAALEIFNASHVADHLDDLQTLAEISEELLEEAPGWRKRTALWERGGVPAAFALLWAPEQLPEDRDAFLRWDVHPDARDPQVADAVLAWADAATLDAGVGAENVSCGVPDRSTFRAESLVRLGFEPVRYFLRLHRDLTAPIPDHPVAEGYRIRPLRGAEEAGAWVAASNASFIDHWNNVPDTVEQRLKDMASTRYRPDLDLVAEAPDGRIAAFCWGSESLQPDGSTQHWIGMLGTAREHRNRGLAKALLTAGMRLAAADGATVVRLGVDADSPTGATRLYDQMGFTIAHRSTVYRRRIATAPPERPRG